MARDTPSVRKLLADAVAPVVADYGGPAAVAKAAGVHRSTVGRWVKGEIGWDGLADLASALRREIVVTFPAHGQATLETEEAPPPWAGALARQVQDAITAEIQANRAIAEDVRASLSHFGNLLTEYGRRLAAAQPPAGGAAPKDGAAKARGTRARRTPQARK